MATYVPGYQRYEREAQPFTPDYKFLSAVLDTRQDRYDTNYKQLSDQYSKVVYADVSRDDTKNARDQYTKQLIPEIEKLSGMDLSMRQNVDAAKGLFKPFYQDDLIVKDIVFTSQFKKNAQLASAFKSSDSSEERKKYWPEGMQALNYQMQDFISADRDSALKAGLPRYVENIDLHDMSMKILKEAGFEDVIMDIPPKKGDPFIIRQKNGSLQVPGAYNYLMKTLMEDPKVVDAYRTSGLVKARNFAEIGVQNGQFNSLAEGKEAWAQQTIEDLRARNSQANPMLKAQFTKALETKQNWERYKEQEGIVPDSDEDKEMMEAFQAFENAEGALNRNEESLQKLDTYDQNSDGLNFAYNMLMNYNLSSDILGAATAYSKLDYSQTLTENPYTKMQIQHSYNIARDNNASANRRAEAILKGKIEGNVNSKGEIINPAFLASKIFDGATKPGAFTTTFENAETVKDPYLRNLEDREKQAHKVALEKANFITSFVDLQNSGKPIKEQSGKITVELSNGDSFTGTSTQVKDELLKPKNVQALNKLYADSFKDFTELSKTNKPALRLSNGQSATGNEILRLPVYQQLALQTSKISTLTDQMISFDKLSKREIAKNWETAQSISAIGLGENIKKGTPSIVVLDGNERGEVLPKDEFIKNYIQAARNNQIKDVDLYEGRGLRSKPSEAGPDGSSNEEGSYRWYDYINVIGRPLTRMTDAIAGDLVFDVGEARSKAEEAYDKQYKILNNTLNETYSMRYDTERKGLFQPLSADAYFRNVSLDEMNASNLYSYGGYKETFQVENVATNPRAAEMVENLYRQYTSLSPQQKIITPTGNEGAPDLDGPSDNVADYIFQQTISDIEQAMRNPKAAESKKLMVGIEYLPVNGQNDEGQVYAGMKIKLRQEHLDKYKDQLKEAGGDLTNYNEITMLYPTTTDLNPRRAGEYNFSSVETKLQLSDDNTYLYDMFDDSAGSFRIFNKDGVYYNSMEMLKVDPNTGNFITAGQRPVTPILDENRQPVGVNEIDRYVANYETALATKSAELLQEQARVKKQLGVK